MRSTGVPACTTDATNSAVAAARPKARGVGPRRRWQGRTRCARPPPPEILRSRVAFSTGLLHGSPERPRDPGGSCDRWQVSPQRSSVARRPGARRPAADGCRASEPSPPPTCQGLASAQETTREGHARSPLVRHGYEIAVDRRDLRALPRSKSSSNPQLPAACPATVSRRRKRQRCSRSPDRERCARAALPFRVAHFAVSVPCMPAWRCASTEQKNT
jgi:hypothetical protein